MGIRYTPRDYLGYLPILGLSQSCLLLPEISHACLPLLDVSQFFLPLLEVSCACLLLWRRSLGSGCCSLRLCIPTCYSWRYNIYFSNKKMAVYMFDILIQFPLIIYQVVRWLNIMVFWFWNFGGKFMMFSVMDILIYISFIMYKNSQFSDFLINVIVFLGSENSCLS